MIYFLIGVTLLVYAGCTLYSGAKTAKMKANVRLSKEELQAESVRAEDLEIRKDLKTLKTINDKKEKKL
jgi:hypothetical protein